MGYSSSELALQLDVERTIDDLPAYQNENAKMSSQVVTELTCYRDISYGSDQFQKLDIFPAANYNAPVLIDIHGGGWRIGSKNLRSFPAKAVTEAGMMWVPIDYGLAPNYSVQQIVDHVRSAITWIYANISDKGGDKDRIFVSGNSAGGHLTGCILMPGWHEQYGVSKDLVKGACAMSGVFDMQALVNAEYGYNEQLAMDMDTAYQNSPLFYLPEAGCPLIVSYGTLEPDEFRRQSHIYYEAWREHEFLATEIIVEDAHHFSMARQLADPGSVLFKAVAKMVMG